MKYSRPEWPFFLIGTLFLFLGAVGDTVVPYYVG